MKAELIVGSRVTKQVELASAPHIGETIHVNGEKLIIKSVIHDVNKRKLQVIGENSNPFEAFCGAPAAASDPEVDTDIDDAE